ncbi:hypothetical protein BJV77DRAFT_974324 [Russula vinacea]|nr:hypothetical protein BJV77DRAFT_974324 [Russula vinacea]
MSIRHLSCQVLLLLVGAQMQVLNPALSAMPSPARVQTSSASSTCSSASSVRPACRLCGRSCDPLNGIFTLLLSREGVRGPLQVNTSQPFE